MKRRKVTKQLLSLLLLIILLVQSIPLEVFAAGTNGADSYSDTRTVENTTTTSGGYSYSGIMVHISTIDNTATAAQKEDIKNQPATEDKLFSEVGYSVENDYYKKYPDFYFQSTTVANSALVVRDGSVSSGVYNMGGNNGYQFAKTYSAASDGDDGTATIWISYLDVISSTILEDTSEGGLNEKFKNRTLTLAEVKALYNQKVEDGDIESQVDHFRALFTDTSRIASYLNALAYSGTSPDEIIKAKAKYLDILLIVNYMTGENSWNVIEDYLKTLNEDNSDNFSVVWFQVVTCYKGVWYSFPSYFAKCTNKSIDYYKNLDMSAYTSEALSSHNWSSLIKTTIGYNSGNYRSMPSQLMYRDAGFQWFTDGSGSGEQLATLLAPTDHESSAKGTFGYTCFALAGMRSLVRESDADISLTATSPQSEITYLTNGSWNPEYLTANITVSLQQTTEKQNSIRDVFLTETQKGVSNPTLTLTYGMDVTEGGEKNDNGAYDTNTSPDNLQDDDNNKKTTSIGSTAITTWEGISIDDFEKLMSGEQTFTFVDTKIIPDKAQCSNDKLINKYYVSGTLKWSDGKTITFTSVGKQGIGTTTAYDTVEWAIKSEAEGRPKGTFYSVPQEPYVEIKQGIPGNETFEAMAGVPTTEDMYVGFGATEFAVNMDVQYAVNSEQGGSNVRTYTFSYTFNKVYDITDECTTKCNGHSVSGTCSKQVPNASGIGTHACGASLTGSCKDGTVTCSNGHNNGSYPKNMYYGENNDHVITVTNADGTTTTYRLGGYGCAWESHRETDGSRNPAHAVDMTYTFTIQQSIDDFAYIDITGLELWRTNKLTYLDSEEDVFAIDEEITVDPETGYKAFYEETGYSNGNGRLYFHTLSKSDGYENIVSMKEVTDEAGNALVGSTSDTASNYGDYQVTYKDEGAKGIRQASDAASIAKTWATNIVNAINDNEVSATVISDFCILETTRGYQSIMYNTYDSDSVTLLDDPLTNLNSIIDAKTNSQRSASAPTVDTSKTHAITFSKALGVGKAGIDDGLDDSAAMSWASLWAKNKYAAVGWNCSNPAISIVRSGYTGNYADTDGKYNNGSFIMTEPENIKYALELNTISIGGSHSNYVKLDAARGHDSLDIVILL